MANQQRFEGPELSALLEQVRAELGAGARIISANRIRKGGVGGFFTREVYEVIAERGTATTVAAAPAAAAPAVLTAPSARVGHGSTGGGPSAILDLAEAVNEVERERSAARAAGAAFARAQAAAAAPTMTAERGTGPEQALPLGGLAPERPVLSTETPDFAAVLARLSDETDFVPAARRAEPEFDEPIPALLTDGESWAWSAEHDTLDLTDAEVAAVMPNETMSRPTPQSPAPYAERAYDAWDDEDWDDDLPERDVPLTPVVRAFVPPRIDRSELTPGAGGTTPVLAAPMTPRPDATRGTAAWTDAISAHGREVRAAATVAEPARPALAVRAPKAAAAGSDTDSVLDRPEVALRRLGVPARFIPRGASGPALATALTESLQALPTAAPLPATRGVVVAIIGASSYELARRLAAEWGVESNSVVFATPAPPQGTPEWMVITDSEAARERRCSWQRREQPTIVVIDEPRADHTDATWVRSLLDHLEPTQTWMLVDARTKTEDVEVAISGLGGIDVIALTDVEATASPAAVLELGIPVGRIDGGRAEAGDWSSYLTQRLTPGSGVK